MKPKITVLVSYYNYRKFVEEAVASIFKQTLNPKDFEVMIINEGNIEDLIMLQETYPRLKVINKPDENRLAKVWNYGIKRARGKYIKVLDSDDMLLPNCLKEEVPYLDGDEKVGLVCAHHKWLIQTRDINTWMGIIKGYARAKIKKTFSENYKDFCYDFSITKEMFKVGNPVSIPTVMFRKKCGLFDERMRIGEDFEFWLRIAQKWQIVRLPMKLAVYRVHGGQQTKRKDWSKTDLRILEQTKHRLLGNEKPG